MMARPACWLTAITALLVLTSPGIPAQDASPESGPQKQEQSLLSLHREVPDDPPGQPAVPIPGSPAARKIRAGRFVSVQVNVDEQGANIWGDAANEPSIAVDPTNPLRMAIGWRQFDTQASNFRQAGVGHTTDGGRTWTFPGVLDPGNFRSDPVLSFDTEGNFYYCSLEGDFTCDVFKSTDGGETWGPPVFSYGGDKEWLAVDRSFGLGNGHIYSYWTGNSNQFTRSIDGGASFQSPVSIPDDPVWGTMDVDADGVLHVLGSDGSSNPDVFLVSTSEDARNPKVSPTFTTQEVDVGGSVAYFDGPNPGGLLGMPWIAVDTSDGPTSGNIYILCSVDPPGSDPMDVHFVRSTDGGSTWSSPVRVNDDPTNLNAWQWFGTMSVGQNGRIDAVWNDTRMSGTTNWSELWYSKSEDGGVTWSQNERLSPMWDSYEGWPQQDKIGDYYDMVSDRVGANLAWAATFNGEQDVYYLRIGDYDCNQNGVGDSTDIAEGHSPDANGNGIPDECESPSAVSDVAASTSTTLHSFPNPFSSATTIHFNVAEGGEPVRLQIFNAEGRLVRTLLDGFASPGPNSLRWDGRDDQERPVAPGLYFYKFEGAGETQTGRTLLVK